MSKTLNIAAGLAVLPALAFAGTAVADNPGQFATGNGIYIVRNVTSNGNYGSSASVACNDTVKYSLELSNQDFGTISNVTAKASLTSGQASASGTASNGKTVTTGGTVNVSLPANSSLQYDSSYGTYLKTSDGTVISKLSDGITSGSVNVGDIKGSTSEYLQFQANVKCVTPPTPQPIQVCDLKSMQIVTIDKSQYDSSKYSTDLSKCKVTPPTPKKITVCELSTKKIVTIDETAYDTSKYSTDLSKCAPTPPKPNQITVCELATKKVVNIDETAFDSSKYSKDLTQCQTTPPTTPTTTTPTALVNTGPGQVVALFAVVATVSAVAYNWVMRRQSAR